MASSQQIESLIQAYIDGELSSAEKVTLERHLYSCKESRALLRRQTAIAAQMFEGFAPNRLRHDLSPRVMAHLPEMDRAALVARGVNRRAKSPRSTAPILARLVPALAPVMIVLAGLALLYSWPDGIDQTSVVGVVARASNGTLRYHTDDMRGLRVVEQGYVLRGDRYETGESDLLALGLAGPTVLKADADTRIRVDHDRFVSVETGRVYFDVAEGERFFRVQTPSGDITVFGTAFGVEVDNGETVVTLREGEVTVDNGVAFTVLEPGQQVRVRLNQKPLTPVDLDVDLALAWADAIAFDQDQLELALDSAASVLPTVLRAEQIFLLNTRNKSVQSITFYWEPDLFTSGHAGYNVFVSDGNLRPVHKDYIPAGRFADKRRTEYTIAIPADAAVDDVNVLHIRIAPDFESGTIETTFVEPTAIGL